MRFPQIEPIRLKERASKLRLMEKLDEIIGVVNVLSEEMTKITEGFERAREKLSQCEKGK